MIQKIAALSCALLIIACGKRTQLESPTPPDGSRREYDWERGILLSEVPISRFKPATISVVRLNPLCFDYKRELQTKEIQPPSFEPMKELLGVAKASKAAEGTKQQFTDAIVEESSLFTNLAAPILGDDHKVLRNTLPLLADELKRHLLDAAQVLSRARTSLRIADTKISAVGAGAEILAQKGCSASIPFSHMVAEWTSVFEEGSSLLAQATPELISARSYLERARQSLQAASLAETQLERNNNYILQKKTENTAGATLAIGLSAGADEAEEVEKALHETDARLVATKKALTRADITVRSLRNGSELSFTVRPGLRDAQYEVVMTATPKPIEGKESSAKTETRKFIVPVSGTLRVVASAGFVFAPTNAPIYARTNRPWLHVDSVGKTFSTYDVTDREQLAYAPMIKIHGMCAQLGPIPIGLGFGAAVRQVRGKQGMDFLLGVTGSFQDHLFMTVGAYNARREYLRLGDVNDVRAYPVPTAITDVDAIGVERGWSPGFSVSFRN